MIFFVISLIISVICIFILFKYNRSNINSRLITLPKTKKLKPNNNKLLKINTGKRNEFKQLYFDISYSSFPENYLEKSLENHKEIDIDIISDKLLNSSFSFSLDEQSLLMTNNDDITSKELTAMISNDPALSAKVLQIVNSPFFGFRDEVTSIFKATVLMGNISIKNIITQYMLRKNVCKFEGTQEANFSHLWKHSTITSAIARYLSLIKFGQIDNDPTTIALLHNIGKYYMFFMDTEYKYTSNIDLIMEDEKYGYNHAQLGNAICHKWKLPDSISKTIKYHHYPAFVDIEHVPEHIRLNVSIIYLSTIITDIFLNQEDTLIYPMRDSYFEYLKISNNIDNIITPALMTEMNKANTVIEVLSPS